jgi:mono/diheme cytochrome c family protein
MKTICLGIGVLALLCASAVIVHAQDKASGEKMFKARCAGCHGADAAGKAAVKSPSIKGKSADDIEKAIAGSPKHASLKNLTPDEIKNIAAFLSTLK